MHRTDCKRGDGTERAAGTSQYVYHASARLAPIRFQQALHSRLRIDGAIDFDGNTRRRFNIRSQFTCGVVAGVHSQQIKANGFERGDGNAETLLCLAAMCREVRGDRRMNLSTESLSLGDSRA